MGTSLSTRRWQLFIDIMMATAFPIVAYLAMRSILSRLDIGGGDRDKKKSTDVVRKLERLIDSRNQIDRDSDSNDSHYLKPKPIQLELSEYEKIIVTDVILPDDIRVTFQDIGGLDSIIEELRESVIYPLTMPHLYEGESDLACAPSGVLFYGPPGCGKTMLAKALARESGATFINLDISSLTNKWFGDSNKLVKAAFSLARKVEPCIVFIDEIDALMGTRRSGEHEASGMLKAEFMIHWDGLASVNSDGKPQRICVVGSTNRLNQIDEAILRRMPKMFSVPLPNASQRKNIFQLILRKTKIDSDRFDLDLLVQLSEGISASAIKEKCRDAALIPIRESRKAMNLPGNENLKRHREKGNTARGIRTTDFGVPEGMTVASLQPTNNRTAGTAPSTASSISRLRSKSTVGNKSIDTVDPENGPWEDVVSNLNNQRVSPPIGD